MSKATLTIDEEGLADNILTCLLYSDSTSSLTVKQVRELGDELIPAIYNLRVSKHD